MAAAPVDDRKRVKVYELRQTDWYDRGTGFCVGEIVGGPDANPDCPDARIVVHSEERPGQKILETRITKDDGYQQQQQTLIVWTEADGVDMALSFQEAEGCTTIWQFVSEVQSKLSVFAPEGGLSDDDMLDTLPLPIALPKPQLGRLEEVVATIRNVSGTPSGREALVKFIMNPDSPYIDRLAPLVEDAEDLESVHDLHQLCNIMKHLILLNDNSIIEYVVTDNVIMGVLGALEYDPDFPSHRAAHRQFLRETSKFKEVVKFKDPEIRNKIQYTHRLLYLKDVVLARILDDPTFSVLNSLIFFHHVDIIQYITSDSEHCEKLFAIIKDEKESAENKKIAVLFIQNCCAVAKNIQPANREKLYTTLISHGLFSVVSFALRHHDASVRVAGTDVLVSLIDSDPNTVRNHMIEEGNRKDGSLMDTLIELLLVEVDLGVKSQMADAIKILLDPTLTHAALESMHRHQPEGNKRGSMVNWQQQQHAEFNRILKIVVTQFYADGVQKLFQPLNDLEHREDMNSLTVQELNLYTHLVEILCFFARQHNYDLTAYVRSENMHAKIARLLRSRKKYMRLVALKWFRTCIGLQDATHRDEMMREQLFEPILDIVYETMPRDNLLNSACLEIFDFIRAQNIRPLVQHLGSLYRDRLHAITYVPTFRALLAQYEENVRSARILEADNSFTTEPDTPPLNTMLPSLPSRREMYESLTGKPANEADFPDDDDDFDGDMIDDDESALPTAPILKSHPPNGHVNSKGPLVDYPDDDDDDDEDDDDRGRYVDILASSPDPQREKKSSDDTNTSDMSRLEDSPDIDLRGRKRSVTPRSSDDCARSNRTSQTPSKRRRSDAEDEDDELGKLMTRAKRRNSSASTTPNTSQSQHNNRSPPSRPDGSDPDLHREDSGSQSPTLPADSPTQDTMQPSPGHGHTLRRKGSLKTKNETAATNGKMSIKLSLGGSKGHHKSSHHKNSSSGRTTSNEEQQHSAGEADG